MTTQSNNSISDERNFRPKSLEDFIGQGDLKKTLRLMLDSAHQRSATLEHVVFYGGPGLEKPSRRQLSLLSKRPALLGKGLVQVNMCDVECYNSADNRPKRRKFGSKLCRKMKKTP